MKGGKREVVKHNVEFRLYNPTEKLLLDWLKEERGGHINMNAAIMDALRLAHFLLEYRPNINVNITPGGYIPAQGTVPEQPYLPPNVSDNSYQPREETVEKSPEEDPDIMANVSLNDGVVSSSDMDGDDDDEEFNDPFA